MIDGAFMDNQDQSVSRRGLVGIGALGSAALLGATSAQHAQAAPPPDGPTKALNGSSRSVPLADPGGARIGSAPISGYSYAHRSFMDFDTLDLGARNWSDTGVYASSGSGEMGTTVDLPPGAVFRDMEWYFMSTLATKLEAYLWTSGSARFQVVASMPVAAGSTALRAQRVVIPADHNGPYASGARLLLWAVTGSGVRINGARVGFTAGPAGSIMLPAPVRVYDSRSGAKIANGQTRTHNLSSWVPAAAVGAILSLTAVNGEGSGWLTVYANGAALPGTSSISWQANSIANEIHTALNADRQIKVNCGGGPTSKTHYLIDLVGYLAGPSI
jgi:hypothetical protein